MSRKRVYSHIRKKLRRLGSSRSSRRLFMRSWRKNHHKKWNFS